MPEDLENLAFYCPEHVPSELRPLEVDTPLEALVGKFVKRAFKGSRRS